MRQNVITKVVLILACLSLTSLALMPPSTGYEHSIYAATPAAVWVLFGALVIAGIILLGVAAIEPSYRRLWPVGFGAVAVACAGYHGIPLARGYRLYATPASDLLVHLGIIQDLVTGGTLETFEYPAPHLLTGSLTLVTGLAPETSIYVVAFWSHLLFIGLFGYCIWSMTRCRSLALLTVIVALPLYFGANRLLFMPYLLAYMMLPLLLATAHRYQSTGRNTWLLAYVCVAVALAFYHPLTMLFGLLILMGYFAIRVDRPHHSSLRPESLLTAIAVVVVIGWYVVGEVLSGTLRAVGLRLLNRSSGAAGTATQSNIFSYDPWQIAILFAENFGVLAVLFGLGLVSTLALLWQWGKGRAIHLERFAASQFILAGMVSSAFFVVQVWGTSVPRAMQYLLIISIIAVALGAWKCVEWSRQSRYDALPAVGVCLIAVAVTLTLFSVAAVGYNDGHHMSDAATSGYGWMVETKAGDDPHLMPGSRDAFPYYHYGYTRALDERSERNIFGNTSPPHRLGYAEHSTLGAAVDADAAYLVLRDADTASYHELPAWQRERLNHYYTDEGRQRVDDDPTAHRIYTNGELDSWRVSSDNAESD